MLSLEAMFALLDGMRGEAIGLIEAPGDQRDAFAFGAAHGRILVIAEIRERLNALIENNNREDDT